MSERKTLNLSSPHICYITSGKSGLESFTFRELKSLVEEYGVDVELCLTQLKKGPYMPKKNWSTHIASKKKILEGTFLYMLTSPKKFISLVRKARKNKTLLYLLLAFCFWKDIKRKNLTHIHVQMGDHKLFIGYYLHKIFDLPLSVTIHAHEIYRRENYDTPGYFSSIWKECDVILTVSDFNKKILVEKYAIPEEKVKVNRLFVDLYQIDQRLNKKYKILISAKWVEKKGHKILFEAVKRLNRDDVVVWCTGDTYESSNAVDLRKMVKEMGIKDKVIFFGNVSDEILNVLFQSCDIFCLPSLTEYYKDGNVREREGIPVSLMEAMAWGKPMISTRHAGIPELVEEILVKENDVGELKNAIEHLITHPEKWGEMGRRNRAIIEKKYSKKNIKNLAKYFLERPR